MVTEACIEKRPNGFNFFERYLTVWVLACIGAGTAVYTNGAPVISIPIAVCLFLYPITVKIDFADVIKAGKSGKPVGQAEVSQALAGADRRHQIPGP